MIGIIEYGLGNVLAFVNIFKKCDIPCRVLKTTEDFSGVTKLILPGVGAFDHAIDLFIKSGMRGKVEELVLRNNMPILGVCVGMQMMADTSEEGERAGLGWVTGRVVKFQLKKNYTRLPLPHMGWNKLEANSEENLLSGLDNSMFYFLHSYHFVPKNVTDASGTTDYGLPFCSFIKNNNIYGMQCHPEKSHEAGIQFLKNFSELT